MCFDSLSGKPRLPIPKEQALKKALTADAFIDASNDITTLTPIYSEHGLIHDHHFFLIQTYPTVYRRGYVHSRPFFLN